MLKQLIAASIVGLCSVNSFASTVATYGWEDGGTVLGEYDPGNEITYSNLSSFSHSGTSSLLAEDLSDSASGTPQGYLAWVNGLTDGDTISASVWMYDTSASTAPSGRIWGHYSDDSGNIDSYAGSAGGNSSYTSGNGWEQVNYTWTFDSSGGARDGFVLEFRFYDGSTVPTGSLLVDDLTITTSSDTATITTPAISSVPLPAAAWLFGGALVAMAGVGRTRKIKN